MADRGPIIGAADSGPELESYRAGAFENVDMFNCLVDHSRIQIFKCNNFFALCRNSSKAIGMSRLLFMA